MGDLNLREEGIDDMSKSYADVLESYVIAEEGLGIGTLGTAFLGAVGSTLPLVAPAIIASVSVSKLEKKRMKEAKLKEERLRKEKEANDSNKNEAKNRIKSTYKIDVDTMSITEIRNKMIPFIIKDIQKIIRQAKKSKELIEKCKEEYRKYVGTFSTPGDEIYDEYVSLIDQIEPAMFICKQDNKYKYMIWIIDAEEEIQSALSFTEELCNIIQNKYVDFVTLGIFKFEEYKGTLHLY